MSLDLKINASERIIDKEGTPTLKFQRKWQDVLEPQSDTVEQITSRTTAVTLNAVAGQITLVSAAGSTSWASFTVNNNKVTAASVPHVAQQSGTDLYRLHVTAVAEGSFRITFATTAGTTTEQPVFNFWVRKARGR